MDGIIQILAGAFYLLNKIFLWLSEKSGYKEGKSLGQKWRLASWVVYLAGLPPWIIIFISEKNWIAASVEASGAPAMTLGLVSALYGLKKSPPKWLDYTALICIPLGFAYSFYEFGGINTINQFLEITLVLGFLIGTYKLAKSRVSGYLWYILMHVACAWLMYLQGYLWLFVQQLVSLIFIGDSYRLARRK